MGTIVNYAQKHDFYDDVDDFYNQDCSIKLLFHFVLQTPNISIIEYHSNILAKSVRIYKRNIWLEYKVHSRSSFISKPWYVDNKYHSNLVANLVLIYKTIIRLENIIYSRSSFMYTVNIIHSRSSFMCTVNISYSWILISYVGAG